MLDFMKIDPLNKANSLFTSKKVSISNHEKRNSTFSQFFFFLNITAWHSSLDGTFSCDWVLCPISNSLW